MQSNKKQEDRNIKETFCGPAGVQKEKRWLQIKIFYVGPDTEAVLVLVNMPLPCSPSSESESDSGDGQKATEGCAEEEEETRRTHLKQELEAC